MKLYAEYIKEREGYECFYTEDAFVSFKITGEECYVRDIYVAKDKRKSKVASDLVDKVADYARDLGCKFLAGSCKPSTNGSTESIKAILGYGFKLFSSKDDAIYFIKEL